MPKSKRDKKVSLTKTNKKGIVLKQKIIEDVRNCVEKFSNIYVFTYNNLRTEAMQEVRRTWKPSRFFFGKNKVVAIALGRKESDEIKDHLHNISKSLKGQCGVLFTDSSEDEVVEWFKSYGVDEFARAGFKTPIKVALNEGPMEKFAHSLEPYLRQLGLPTKLEKGVVTLVKDHVVCKKGDVLTPEQAKIIKLLDISLAQFNLCLKCSWSKEHGFKEFETKEEAKESDNLNEESEDEDEVKMEEDE